MITLSPRLIPILFTITVCLCPFSSLLSSNHPSVSTDAPVHFNDESNLGLPRLFLSDALVGKYLSCPEATLRMAEQAFKGTEYAAFVAGLLAHEKRIPGIHDLDTAVSVEPVSFENRVMLFAHGAVQLYVYAMARGGISVDMEGHDLSYVRDHVGQVGGVEKIAHVIRDYMPAIVIAVVAQYTERFRNLLSQEPDALTRFWQVIGALPPVNSERVEGVYRLNESQHAVYALMLRYQQQRIATYQQMYAEELRKQCGDRVGAARACEAQAVDNGLN